MKKGIIPEALQFPSDEHEGLFLTKSETPIIQIALIKYLDDVEENQREKNLKSEVKERLAEKHKFVTKLLEKVSEVDRKLAQRRGLSI